MELDDDLVIHEEINIYFGTPQKIFESTGKTVSTTSDILQDESHLLDKISNFYNKDELSDVTIKVGNQSYYGHKFILATASDVFKTMLYGQAWKSRDDVLELVESVQCGETFDKFLQFLYKGKVTVNVENCVGILCLADKYNVSSLKQLCVKYMIANVKYNLAYALPWYVWSKVLHIGDLKDKCLEILSWNVAKLLESSQYSSIDTDTMFEILQSSELVIENEYKLFTFVTKWLLDESQADNLPQNCKTILPLVRFPIMEAYELYDVEKSPLMLHGDTKNRLLAHVHDAYRFRSLCAMQEQVGIRFNQTCHMPRGNVVNEVPVSDVLYIQYGKTIAHYSAIKTNISFLPTEEKCCRWKLLYFPNENRNVTATVQCLNVNLIPHNVCIMTSVLVVDKDGNTIHAKHSSERICNIPVVVDKIALKIDLNAFKGAHTLRMYMKLTYI